MDATFQSWQDFQKIAKRNSSAVHRELLTDLLDNISKGEVYAFGGVNGDAFSMFTDPRRNVYSYFLAEGRPLHVPLYRVRYGRAQGNMTFHDWALIDATINSLTESYAGDELNDIEVVRLTGPVRVSLLITVIGETYEPVLLIPKNLTPVQGLVAIYRAYNIHENRINHQLLRRKEMFQ